MKTSTWMSAAFAIALAGAVLGCGSKGKGGGGERLASCNTIHHECDQYGKANRAIGDDYLKRLCTGLEGTFATTPCPTENQTGMCHKDEGTKVFYKDYPMDAAALEKMCTETGGHWMKP